MQSISTSDGRILCVHEEGDPQGLPVVVHHGTPGSGICYAPHVALAREQGIRLVAYDRPGYGGSTRHAERSVADAAADADTIADALGLERYAGWGISGGGPHALATAALLPDRVAAAAALAPVAPFDAEGLDFFEGMGEQNTDDIRAALESEEAHLAVLEREREEFLGTSPEELVDVLETLLGPADREVLTGRIAAYLLESLRDAVEGSLDGWFDDGVAFTQPWGFDLASIRVPVLHWQGEQDKFVPFGHGVWLSQHIPDVESRLSSEDGHLTLLERRIPEVHAWLLERHH